MDKIADYNIRRADQYHPVIQLSAGTIVDVVFLKGFYLDGQKHDNEKESILPPFESVATIPAVLQSAHHYIAAIISIGHSSNKFCRGIAVVGFPFTFNTGAN